MPASRTKPGQYKYAPNSTSQLLTHPIHPPKIQREIFFGRTSGRGNQSSISERSFYAERNTLTESSRGQGQGNRTPHQASMTARDRNP
ncbi:Protein of unknown function [Pyronema omphalodes CBS 100304]|uniref:Uncharacterized protein n=1 Tax=Pyronema omphalodes (strain CBS 100304) TaxID=1076935 RepID=U4LVE4_PYROM|nr:Protein of unknown function [Pyronema omphalodes CBS 100304]